MLKFLIRFLTAFIPAKNLRKGLRKRWLMHVQASHVARLHPRIRERYAKHVANCQAKLARGERLKVAFLICDVSMFSGESVFIRMRDDPRFECFIAVAPRVTRGERFLRETLDKTVDTLAGRYGDAVRALYDPKTGKSGDLDADLVFSTVLYEDQTLPDYTTERLSERSLVSILYYGYGGLFISNERKTPYLPNVVFAWRYFVSNESTRILNAARNPLLSDSMVVAGYCKMDRLAVEVSRGEKLRTRKKVIICPHHTIDRSVDALALSTFLTHADLFLKLPEQFPEIDFVFRPHPLLFPRLETAKWWGAEKTRAYRERMASFPNVEFQQGGDYFAAFADSDAMIHDCGSFLAEYFYTGKPQCYLLESAKTVEEQFLPFSRRLLDYAYRAYTGEEIVSFIRDVVLVGSDPGKTDRDAFAKREVCVNHPHATEAVVSAVLTALDCV